MVNMLVTTFGKITKLAVNGDKSGNWILELICACEVHIRVPIGNKDLQKYL